ncbi:MAG: response regulator [Burkholderiales bacterium]|nr:response regulator [Burkholderiales bacterium]
MLDAPRLDCAQARACKWSILHSPARAEVIEACDGVDALTKLDGRKIHLIISDVNMPNMDGIALVKEVKQKPDYKFTPIIMLTTESQEDKKAQGQAAGASAWVVKPFQSAQMLAAVSKLIAPR